ncbi:MAG: hypothetical protein ACJ76X_12750 [Solirubrobacteraceae bacterium]|jgi:hypothetical protein
MASHDGVMVTRHENDPSALLAFASSLAEIDKIQRQLASLLRDRSLIATLAVDQWSNAENEWQQIRGPEEREARMGRHGLDDSQITFSARTLGLAAAALLAAAGITFYATNPYTFGAFQASTFAIMPLLVIVLIWLHRRLPGWVEWTGAVVLFPVGLVGYLVFGGAQWWNFGQLTAVPFLLLVFARAPEQEAPMWDPGVLEPPAGPFGPP